MKKIFSMLLILCLTFTAAGIAPGQARGEEAARPEAPEAGDVVYGFEAKEIRDYEPMGARITLFEHQKTGAQVTYIANNDLNRGFLMSFKTAAPDDKGLPHVFEHATMYGSEKYPSKTLFNTLLWQAYYTMMTAATNDVETSFPFTSMSEIQLLSIADYYVDCCLHPLFMTDESIFRTQGWHYEMESMDSPLTYNGVVYSEMQGITSIRQAAHFDSLKTAFPGSNVGNHYGGDPDCIPDLTWEEAIDFHNRYYHPSNSMTYLYGDFEDYTAFLKLLDDAFSPFERKDYSMDRHSGYTRNTAPVTRHFSYPVAADMDTENRSVIYYIIPCPGLRDDPAQQMLAKHVREMLKMSSSPMMKNLHNAFPSGVFEIDFTHNTPDDSIVFVAENVGEGDAELLRDIVDQTLRQIAEKGFDDELVESTSVRLRLEAGLERDRSNALEITENDANCGFVVRMCQIYAATGNPFFLTEYLESLERIPEENHEGLLARIVKDWLTEPASWTLTTTSPEPGGKEAHDAALAEKLAGIKAGMSEEDLQAIVEATHAVPEEADDSAMVRSLTPLTVDTLPEEIRKYDITDETGEDHVRRINVKADTEDIGKVYLLFDSQGLRNEDLIWLGLFSNLLGNLGTQIHTREEILSLRERYLMGNAFYCSLLDVSKEEGASYRLVAEWPSLDEGLEKSYELIGEILLDTRFDDVQTLKEIVSKRKSEVRSSCDNSAINLQLDRLAALDDKYENAHNYLYYLDFYDFLVQVEKQLADDPQPVIEKLTELQTCMANRNGAVAGFAGNEKSIALNRKASEALFGRMKDEEREHLNYHFPEPAKKEGIIIDSNIAYNAVGASCRQMGYERLNPWVEICLSVLTEQLVYPALREQMGAYSAYALEWGNFIILASYMDPNVAATFEFYETLPEKIRNLEITQEEMDPYIIYQYAYDTKPKGELSGAVSRIVNAITGTDPEKKLETLHGYKETTPQHLLELADMIEKLLAAGNRSTVGNAGMIRENAELYDVILNPFGE